MTAFEDLPSVITVAEAAQFMRIGLNTCYSAVKRGEVPCSRVGGRILISKHVLMDLLGGRSLVGAAARSGS
jgi:excisionase family DNA binding protein